MEQPIHQTQHHHATNVHQTHPAMHMSVANSNMAQMSVNGSVPTGLATTTGNQAHPNYLPSPSLTNSVGGANTNNLTHSTNAPCSTLFVANLGQFVSDHEIKEVFSRAPGLENMNDMLSVGKKLERDLKHYHHPHQFLMTKAGI